MARPKRNFRNPPVGATHWDLTVLGFYSFDAHSHAIWRFRCKCGAEVQTRAATVLAGDIKRCGNCSRSMRQAVLPVFADRDAVLVDLFASGKTFTMIGEEQGVSRNVVAGAVWRARQKGLLHGRTKIGAAA